MKSVICAGNWKLNKGPKETQSFLEKFLSLVPSAEDNQFVLFPPAIDLVTVSQFLQNRKIGFGLQNCYSQDSGAFTGENSAQVAQELGASFGLVGHSERRQIFKETDGEISLKVKHLQDLGVTPVLCVGETWPEREQGKTAEVVLHQVLKGLEKTNLEQKFWIAYEPVWAIGTGKVASPEQAEEVHALIREYLKSKLKVKQFVPLLYGGSVKAENAQALASQKNVDGFLVGGASLDPLGFYSIYKNSLA